MKAWRMCARSLQHCLGNSEGQALLRSSACTAQLQQAHAEVTALDLSRRLLTAQPGWRCGKPARGFAASAAGSSTAGASRSHLFENIKSVPELEQAAAAAAAAKAQQAEQQTATSRLASAAGALGTVAVYSLLAAGAFFGYYTLRYTSDQVRELLEEQAEPGKQFPGSQVWTPVMESYLSKRREIESEVSKFRNPSSDTLLPPLPEHASHVRTLVLDLDELLVKSDWTRGRGWRTFKRPGAEDFIRQLAQCFELVVYTSALPTYADPILERLDPQRCITYRLYRDSTLWHHGKHVRDLSKLNRDLGKVLFVTADPGVAEMQADNVVKVKPWKLEPGDHELLDLLPFLEAVYRTSVPDVREVVRSYEGQDIASAFRDRMLLQQQLAQQKRAKRPGLFSLSR